MPPPPPLPLHSCDSLIFVKENPEKKSGSLKRTYNSKIYQLDWKFDVRKLAKTFCLQPNTPLPNDSLKYLLPFTNFLHAVLFSFSSLCSSLSSKHFYFNFLLYFGWSVLTSEWKPLWVFPILVCNCKTICRCHID